MSSSREIDLEQLSRSYDFRPPSGGEPARVAISAEGLAGLALDIGGGRGDHARLMTAIGLDAVVVDLEPLMCASAQRSGTAAVCAASEALPLEESVACLSYFHMSIHYGDWRRALNEAVRVTRPGGRIEIWTFTHDGLRASSLAAWFPSVGAIDVERFPDPAEVVRHLDELGCRTKVTHLPETVERRAGDWIEAVEHRFVSTLQLLSDDEINKGLANFRAEHPDPDEPYEYTLHFVRISSSV